MMYKSMLTLAMAVLLGLAANQVFAGEGCCPAGKKAKEAKAAKSECAEKCAAKGCEKECSDACKQSKSECAADKKEAAKS